MRVAVGHHDRVSLRWSIAEDHPNRLDATKSEGSHDILPMLLLRTWSTHDALLLITLLRNHCKVCLSEYQRVADCTLPSSRACAPPSAHDQRRYRDEMADHQSRDFHPAFEEYCETIFQLHEDDVPVIQARIAERLGVSRPAVSEMIRRMDGEGLVSTDNGVRLTRAGQTLGERVVRRHRLAERLLTDVLGLGWADAHEEAGRWEHVISDGVEAAMVALLDDPTTCPHGNPIPGSAYSPTPTIRLSDVQVGTRFAVVRIPEELEFTAGLLAFLEDAAIKPGNQGNVTASSPDGTTTVEVDGRHIGIGSFASTRIRVTAAT
jgi:DtxR family Mn-dependent transcriptional regulator